MEEEEQNCKHQRLPRNCYLCYLHRHDNEPVNFQDMIFTTLSQLKVRISKLEEYKRLQDDVNGAHGNQLFALHDLRLSLIQDIKEINKCIFALNDFKNMQITNYMQTSGELNVLHEHRKKQIDENRAVSKHLDELDSEIDRQLKNQNNINVVLLDKFKSIIKDEIIKTKEDMVATPIKTTGLTFEEAITLLKAGKNITIKGSNNYMHVIMDHNMFSRAEILSNDWEILE